MEQVCNTVMIPREEYDALVQQRDHLESENAKQAVMLNKVIEQRDEAIFNHQAETACSDQLFAQLEAMTQQRDELLAALAFYANDEVYKSDSIGRPIDIAYVARAAIAKVKP